MSEDWSGTPGRAGQSAGPRPRLADGDVLLLERLGRLADVVDPVPHHVLEAARAVYAFRDPDAELMTAVAVDSGRLAAVRGTAPTSRMHFFEFGDLSIDVELTVTGAFGSLVGAVADGALMGGATVTVDTPSASFTTVLDDDGRFSVSAIPLGLVRLCLERPGRPRIDTPWFEAG